MPIRITGLNSGLDTESIISALVSSYNYKTQKYEKAQTKLSWKQDAWKSLNTKIYSLYNSVGNLRFTSAYSTKKATVSNSSKVSVTAGGNAVNGLYNVQVESLATSDYTTGAELSGKDGAKITKSSTLKDLGYEGAESEWSLTVSGKEKKINISGESTIQNVLDQLKKAGVNASFDEKNGRIFVNSKNAGESNKIEFLTNGAPTDSCSPSVTNEAPDDPSNPSTTNAADNAWDALGLIGEGAVQEHATDAKIWVNGAEYTGESNVFTINGLTITATGVTGEYNQNNKDAVTVNVDVDAQSIYDKVKEFISQYNAIMNEMSTLYNAESSKGYEPLTDEEKDAMSDTEVEKWEEKIKSSILRRDDTIYNIMNSMANVMAKGIDVDLDGDKKGDGKTYYLSDFGIKTLGYLYAPKNERYAYHIDGDEDDTNTSGNDDKLMAAITEDPEAVIGFMKQLSTELYNTIGSRMKSTSLSSSYTVYNDKEMASEYSDYTSLITKWKDRLEKQEEAYYKKFAAMESALAKINSQTSSLTGLLG